MCLRSGYSLIYGFEIPYNEDPVIHPPFSKFEAPWPGSTQFIGYEYAFVPPVYLSLIEIKSGTLQLCNTHPPSYIIAKMNELYPKFVACSYAWNETGKKDYMVKAEIMYGYWIQGKCCSKTSWHEAPIYPGFEVSVQEVAHNMADYGEVLYEAFIGLTLSQLPSHEDDDGTEIYQALTQIHSVPKPDLLPSRDQLLRYLRTWQPHLNLSTDPVLTVIQSFCICCS